MTKEEAARVLKAQADYYGKLFASMVTAGDYSELRELETRMEALEVGAAALRGPQPDPETGIMPCGCGGVPVPYSWDETLFSGDTPCLDVTVACQKCGMGGNIWHESKLDAINWWNAAMGWRVEG